MPQSKKSVIVFYMTGCPACHDYVPRFKKIAVKYRAFLSIRAANISTDPKARKIADALKIEGVPTTIVFNAQDKPIETVVGGVSNREIETLLRKYAG